jgi:ADP-heptose:LPS heptosyltransferase
MPPLQIYDRRERALVGVADHALAVLAAVARPFRRRVTPRRPARILLLRLERIGDLLMALPGIAAIRAAWPGAELDLVVGSWNAPLAGAITGITRVQPLDAAWLAREGAGRSLPSLLGAARRWRRRHYDLAVNFEPDIRSNLLLAVSGAAWTAGYSTGGGGPLLDQALAFDPRAHTTANARRLAAAVTGTAAPAGTPPWLDTGARAAGDAGRLLAPGRGPLIGLHASGGREIKQWPLERFAAVGRRLLDATGGTIVLTGSPADRPLVETIRGLLPADRTIDATAAGDLLTSAAILEQLRLLITGDTGPMHLAAAVGDTHRGGVRPVGPHTIRAPRTPRSGRAGRAPVRPL